jgi:O-acetyl-ADP-ribose deacetylase
MRIDITQGNIVHLGVDAIVNAANPRLLGGGGVDGAIHNAAGPDLKAACAAVTEIKPDVRCPVGDVRVTFGYDLPAKWVIHTVGPLFTKHGLRAMRPGETVATDPEADLARCINTCLEAAYGLGAKTIAFPAISCGVYGGEIETFAKIAIPLVKAFSQENDDPFVRVVFCLFTDLEHDTFKATVVQHDLLTAP